MESLMVALAAEHPRAVDRTRVLPTPVLEIEEGIVLIPVVGVIDARRAAAITEELLEGLGRTRARVVLIDTTGVPWMDELVVSRLLGTVPAARLLGANVILTGISGQVAATIVSMRAGLEDLTCAADLRSGVELGRRLLSRQRAGGVNPRSHAGAGEEPRASGAAYRARGPGAWSLQTLLSTN